MNFEPLDEFGQHGEDTSQHLLAFFHLLGLADSELGGRGGGLVLALPRD